MRTKWLLVGGAVLSLVLAGGGASYLFLGGSETPKAALVIIKPGYVDIDSLAAPVMREGRLSHYIHLVVTVEVGDEDKIERVENRKPALRDAFLRALYRAPIGGEGEVSATDLKAAKSRLLEAAREIVGEGVVDDVLLTRSVRGPA